MVAYFYKANKKVRLTPERRSNIASTINQWFKDFYPDLEEPKQETLCILKEVFPTYDRGKEKINKIPSLYEQYKTYTSAIQRACYPSYDAMLDIEGQDRRSNDLAATYKASLIYDWYNINLLNSIDECQDDWAFKGEAAVYICWRENIVQIKEQEQYQSIDEFGIPRVSNATVTRDIETFKGVDVKRIDPHNLYFDKSQVDNWKACRKIYRDFVPLEEVLSNTSYDLTPEEQKELRQLVYGNTNCKPNDLYKTKIDSDKKIVGSTVEVLEFEGNYIDPETYEVYTNIEASVIAGRYVAKFRESTKPDSSIIFSRYMARPDTGRGQSPLRIPEILNEVQNMCADMTLQSWKLQTYPTFLTPKGALPHYIPLEAGKPIEYDTDILGGQTPQKLDFSSGLRGFDFADFFQRKMENATGINQYMQGNLDSSVRTASEASYIHSGASMRMAREAHLFSKFLFKLVRKYALFKKVYDTEDKQVNVGEGVFATVTKEVREGDYTFIIGGSQSAVEREAETMKLFQLLGLPAFQSLMGLIDPVTASEFLRWVLNRANFKATEQIVDMMNLNGQLKQLANQLGIQSENYEGFRRDMVGQLPNYVPQMVTDYLNGIDTTVQQ